VSRPLDWERDGKGWPNREASRFVRAAGIRWQVQSWGRGPTLLLVHGTGAATHSWRDLAPLLARRFTLVAPTSPATVLPPRFPAACRFPPWPGHWPNFWECWS
jgi:magnesium chelatase accessory protein